MTDLPIAASILVATAIAAAMPGREAGSEAGEGEASSPKPGVV